MAGDDDIDLDDLGCGERSGEGPAGGQGRGGREAGRGHAAGGEQVSEIPAELAARIPDAAGQTLTAERVRRAAAAHVDLGPDHGVRAPASLGAAAAGAAMLKRGQPIIDRATGEQQDRLQRCRSTNSDGKMSRASRRDARYVRPTDARGGRGTEQPRRALARPSQCDRDCQAQSRCEPVLPTLRVPQGVVRVP